MIAIVDYGMGNLASVYKAVRYTGNDAVITSDFRLLDRADAVILPGVGAMSDAMHSLETLGLAEYLPDMIAGGKPFLGICLGLQMLFDFSDEGIGSGKNHDGVRVKGLGIYSGQVVRFPDRPHLKVPHMGWNKLSTSGSKFIGGGEYVYFVHSFYAKPKDYSITSAHSRHGVEFAASIERNNVFATQFHPEKSGEAGIRILNRWIDSTKSNKNFPGLGFLK
ncbi:MAG: imidazole glycerol phosphate synthase subunit HisH [Saccharofermentanales bacterium]